LLKYNNKEISEFQRKTIAYTRKLLI
jgi:hypothetical protein